MNVREQMKQLFTTELAQTDPAVAAAISGELTRQRNEIELIASENIVSASRVA